MTPEDVLPTYNHVARDYAKRRDGTLFERAWLDRMLSVAQGKRVLDLGCGSGHPIARYLSERGCQITGVDGAPAMVQMFQENLPNARVVQADMRHLALGEKFDAILAWNSFFHLTPEDQIAMLPVFAGHAAPGAALLFTAGDKAGSVQGYAGDAPVYHASLAPADYAPALAQQGFSLRQHTLRDPKCQDHSVFLARFRTDV